MSLNEAGICHICHDDGHGYCRNTGCVCGCSPQPFRAEACKGPPCDCRSHPGLGTLFGPEVLCPHHGKDPCNCAHKKRALANEVKEVPDER